MTRTRAGVLLGLLAVFWGANWPIMKIGLEDIPPFVFRTGASLSGAAGLFLIARLGRLPMRVPPGQWRPLLMVSLLNISGWNILVLYGIDLMNAGRAGIIAYTMPLWATLVSVPVLGERLSLRIVAALVVGMAGMGLLFAADFDTLAENWLGPTLVLLAAMMWGAGTVAIRYYRIGLPVTSLTAWQHLVGTVPIAVVALLFDVHNLGEVGRWPAMALLYNMTIASIFCYWAYFSIASALPIPIATIGTLAVPALGVLFTAIIYREAPRPLDYAALGAVCAAVGLVMWRRT